MRDLSEWWRGAVIYQVYPRSFQDSNGDGVGDLPGITRRLEHIADLGVDAVWISPFFKSPMADYGYDVEDYRQVDPLFGRLADFEALLEKAHGLGLKVLVDLVPCHTSDRHPWFLEARQSRDNPRADWYVFAEPKADGTPPNNWLSIFGGVAWTWEPRRSQYYLHNFLREQPQLNWHNPDLAEAMLGEAEFWLRLGIDGFRVDAIDFALHDPELRDNPVRPPDLETPSGMVAGSPFSYQIHRYQRAHPELSDKVLLPLRRLVDRYGGGVLLGEVTGHESLERVARYTDGGGLDIAYTFDLLRCSAEHAPIREIVETFESVVTGGWACWSFSNHDITRGISRFAENGAAAKLQPVLTALLGSLRGTVGFYQGEELGLPDADLELSELQDPYGIAFYPLFKGRDGCRTPIPWEGAAPAGGFSSAKPWLPVPEDHLARAVDRQSGDEASVLERTRRFFHWRRTQPALLTGDIEFLQESGPLYAFLRRHAEQTLLCAFNLGPEPAEVAAPAGLQAAEGHGFTSRRDGGRIALPGYGAFFGALEAGGDAD